jgi:hypothetical protein
MLFSDKNKIIMGDLLITAKSHPALNWLKELKLPTKVPPAVTTRVMKAHGPEGVEALARQICYGPLPLRVIEITNSIYAIEITHPAIGRDPAFSLTLSMDISGQVPLGSATLRFSLPRNEELMEGQKIFARYQSLTGEICRQLFSAVPFAGIMGYEVEQGLHIYSERGFNLFFSSNPDQLFDKISSILELKRNIRQKENEFNTPEAAAQSKAGEPVITPAIKKRRAEEASQLLQSKQTEKEAVHSVGGANVTLLSHVQLYKSKTTLVDLR